jgi:hypothetical protein
MINTLPLHDDTAQVGTVAQRARRRGPDQRHIALLASIIKKTRNLEGWQACLQRCAPQIDIGITSIKPDAHHLNACPESA